MRRWHALAVAATILAARAAHADPTPVDAPSPPPLDGAPPAADAPPPSPPAADAPSERPDRIVEPAPRTRAAPSKLRRFAAVGAAIVPGVFVRGAGSFILGERRTAKRLLATGAVGLTVAAAGALAVGTTRANPYFVWPGVPIMLAGAGVFLPTWFGDIWVAAGGERVKGGPRGTPPWSLELATTWLHDAYRERALAGASARIELGRLGLGAGTLLDAQGDARTGELEVRFRILGAPAANRPIDEGSRLHVRAGGRLHRDDADDVTLATGELEVVLRGELRHLDPLLAGTFLELSAGLGVERATYARDTHDVDSILLGRFAWGAYLGRRGEAMLFYDHRRDHLAGGLWTWRASGFNGSFGAAAQLVVAGPWAVRAEVEVGSAWVSTFALRYQGGQR